jgi:hypothetical protein
MAGVPPAALQRRLLSVFSRICSFTRSVVFLGTRSVVDGIIEVSSED